MVTQRVRIIVSSDGTVTVKKDIEGVGKAAKDSAAGVDFLKTALAALVSVQTIRSIVTLGDGFTRLQNSLKIAGLEGERLSSVQNTLFDQANRNGVEVESLAQVYNRMSLAQKELGATGEDMLTVTSGIAASLRMTGLSADQARGPMLQLSQALGNGIVRAEEWNSITEGMLPIAQAAARGMDGMGGSVAKLRMAILAGEVTSKQFFDALKVGFAETEAQALKAQLTVGQAMTVMRNQLMRFVGEVLNSRGVMAIFADSLVWVAFNLEKVLLILSPLIAALTILAVQVIGTTVVNGFLAMTNAIGMASKALIGLYTLIMANPLVAIGVAIAAIIVYFIDWEKLIYRLIQAWGILVETIGTALDALGLATSLTERGLEIQVNAEQAAADLIGAASAMGDELASKMSGGITTASIDGGKSLGDGVRKGASDGAKMLANAQKAAVAKYEQMNGKAVKEMGDTLVEGGKYMYNQVTGGVKKAGNEAKTAIEDGGKTAATDIGTSMKSAGQSAAGEFEAAGVRLTGWVAEKFQDMMEYLIITQIRHTNAQAELLRAQAALARAEAREKGQADPTAVRFGVGGGRGSGSGGGGGGRGSSEVIIGDIAAYRDRMREEAYNLRNGTGPAGTVVNGGEERTNDNNVTINNVVDPNGIADVLDTSVGKNKIINIMKLNRDEVLAALGRA